MSMMWQLLSRLPAIEIIILEFVLCSLIQLLSSVPNSDPNAVIIIDAPPSSYVWSVIYLCAVTTAAIYLSLRIVRNFRQYRQRNCLG
jgi:hypothetical protein